MSIDDFGPGRTDAEGAEEAKEQAVQVRQAEASIQDEIKRDREVIAAATFLPWGVANDRAGGWMRVYAGEADGTGATVAQWVQFDDAVFIARARTRWPAAIALLDERDREIAALKKQVASEQRAVDTLVESCNVLRRMLGIEPNERGR